MSEIDQPLNPTERYLYGINQRLDALIHMMSAFMEVYAKQNQLATTSNEIQEVPVEIQVGDKTVIRKPRKK